MLKELKDLKLEIYPLTIDHDQEIFFENHGYLHLKGFYPTEVIDKITDHIWKRLPESKEDPQTWKRQQQKVTILDSFCQTELEWQLFSHPKLIKIAECLLKVDLKHLYWGKTGTLVINWPTQKDWTTFHLESSFNYTDFDEGAKLIYSLIYLNERHPDNAKTKLIPGSNLTVKDYLKTHKKDLSFDEIKQLDLNQPIEINADKGDLLLFDSTLIHSGGGQLNPTPRFLLRTGFHNGIGSLKHIRTKVPHHLKKQMSPHERHFYQ